VSPWLSIENDQKRVMMEGTLINPPYKLRLQNNNDGSAVSGMQCFAQLNAAKGNILPKGFRNSIRNHPVKYLERPIAGRYSDTADDPLSEESVILEYFESDEDGHITFDDMRLSQTGPVGNFTLAFQCKDGKAIALHNIEVQSSIRNVLFAQPPPESLKIENVEGSEYDFTLVIEVSDKNKIGIEGKYPEQIIITAENPRLQNDIEIAIQHHSGAFQSSMRQGVMTIPLKVTKLVQDVTANITLVIDGQFYATTPMIEFLRSYRIRTGSITNMTFVSYPAQDFEAGLQIGATFDVRAKFTDILGREADIKNYNFKLSPYIRSVGQSDLPYGFVSFT
jgi:hypothetical protein